ncbi:ankyrin repeat domain-containing protein [Deinococcus lacus]|uniref:Ankyrin repeat domain-containing protein n=1 Tax=Deinococcus lacus TaxID=392561 RepID=A0ABW1YAA6_9DEIO
MSHEPLPPEVLELLQRMFDLARSGDAGEMAAWFDRGVPLNLTNEKGDTLLMLAAYNGQPEVVELLLKRGADAGRANDRGQTPLQAAAFKGDAGMVRRMLDLGVDVNGAGPDGRTPLMLAAMFDRLDILDLLLERGADGQARDAAGFSALDAARQMGAERAAARLTELGLAE